MHCPTSLHAIAPGVASPEIAQLTTGTLVRAISCDPFLPARLVAVAALSAAVDSGSHPDPMTSCLLRIIGCRPPSDEPWMKISAPSTLLCHVVPPVPILPQHPSFYSVAVCQIEFAGVCQVADRPRDSSNGRKACHWKSEFRLPDSCTLTTPVSNLFSWPNCEEFPPRRHS